MAGSWTVGKSKITDRNNVETGRMIICTFTADAAAATVPDLVIAEATGSYTEHFKWVKGWYLRAIETDPGTTNPTALYDITITNSRGWDIAGAAVTNRSASLTQTITPRDSDGVAYSPCWDDASGYTIAVANNAVNSATAAIRLFFSREPLLGGSADANLQVGNADVSVTNPVPIKGGTIANTTKISPTGGSKTVTTAGTAEALVASETLRTMLYLRAKSTNTGDIYLGDSAVDKTTSQQIVLDASQEITIEAPAGYCLDINEFYIDASVDGEGVDFLYV